MKLTKKQEAIKAKILAGTHVLKTDGKSHDKAANIIGLLSNGRTTYFKHRMYYGLDEKGDFIFLYKNEINDRPIINMSEWFEESEEPSESTKDMREYDEKLLKDYNVYVIENDLEEDLLKARRQFLNQRYPNEALLKEKSELEQRLKEIEEQLGSEG